MFAPRAPRGDEVAGETVLAFDFGARFVGVAVGDTVTGLAHPLETIESRSKQAAVAGAARVAAEWRPARLVVGLPLALDGSEHEMTRRARGFAAALERTLKLPVALVDERLSSADARAQLRAAGRGGRQHKALVHPVAAQVILQGYLDEQRRAS
jgi:putative Holliday junction resolvase